MKTRFDKNMIAITFAEAGEPETALSLIQELKNKTGQPSPFKIRINKLVEWIQKYTTSMTFAEKAEFEYALEVLEEVPKENKYILVLGNEDLFANYLMEYAIDVAKRFDYKIIALSALPVDKKLRILNGVENEVVEKFVNDAKTAGRIFENRAKEQEIDFRHIIELLPEQKAIRKLHKEVKNIEFVITEMNNELNPDAVCVCSFI